jgi:hypothetical protein
MQSNFNETLQPRQSHLEPFDGRLIPSVSYPHVLQTDWLSFVASGDKDSPEAA